MERATKASKQRNEEKEEILRLLGEWQERETSPIVRWAWADEISEEAKAQEGHEGKEETTTQEECEEKRRKRIQRKKRMMCRTDT